jgi:hypothetical protein
MTATARDVKNHIASSVLAGIFRAQVILFTFSRSDLHHLA